MVGFGDMTSLVVDRLPTSTMTTTAVTVGAAAALAILAFWWTSGKKKQTSQEISLDAQSVEVQVMYKIINLLDQNDSSFD